MQLKEVSKDIYDVSALLDEVLGKEGTPEREKNNLFMLEDIRVSLIRR